MASYIAIFLSLVCLILLVIVLIRFKKLFSTDAIIQKTRIQMNKMITDINSNANTDIELINDHSRRLRALLNESDKKMEQYKLATDRLREMIAVSQSFENKNQYYVQNQNVANIEPIASINPNAVYKVKEMQSSLFDEDNEKSDIMKDETKVTPDGAAYKEVPIIVTKLFDEKPVINKTEKNAKLLKENIIKLFNQGLNAEDIAKRLSCSVAEVQLIIDLL